MELYTIGHSTRSISDLINVLKHYQIQLLVDIRHFPRSRHNPQFNKEELEKAMPKHGIEYLWMESLGGFRSGGYLTHTKTKEFRKGLSDLTEIARDKRTSVMCAEILWFKCHRRFVADILKRKKWKVIHIYDEDRFDKHMITVKKRVKCN